MFNVTDLGCIDYATAWQSQKDTVKAVGARSEPSTLIICRHPPVITAGRQADPANILVSCEDLRSRGIPVYAVERGGDVTYHGPGQISVYPVFDLRDFKKDIHWYLRELEATGMDFLSDYGLAPAQRRGLTGIWVGKRKISSIGIAIKNWVTFHGISINIKHDDLANFDFIRPCGMDVMMTSLETELGQRAPLEAAAGILIEKFKQHFS